MARRNAYTNVRFGAVRGRREVAGFRETTGLTTATDVVEHREGRNRRLPQVPDL
jgi:hypothetical protein